MRRPFAALFPLAAVLLAPALLAAACARPERAEPARIPADYLGWRKTTEIRLDYPIPGHEDKLRVIRMNDLGFTALPELRDGRRHWNFPLGTLVAKEIYASAQPLPGEAPISITAMLKAPEDPRSRGGWLWLTKDLASGKESVFEGNFCVNCHANANEKHPYGDGNKLEEFRDYLFFVPPDPGSGSPPPPALAY